MMKKILITGFEPFAQDKINPSGEWISWMKKQNEWSDQFTKGIVLPVVFNDGFEVFKRNYDDFCPDIVILTGLAKNRTMLSVERIGINWVDARIPDNAGVILSSQKIDQDGPDGLFSTIPVHLIMEIVKKNNVDIKLSTSAGEYVCNELLYRALCYTKIKSVQLTFIHLPGTENYDDIYCALSSLVSELQRN